MMDVHGIQVNGGSLPAQIWHDYMAVAVGNDCADFPQPQDSFSAQPFFGSYSATGGRDSGGSYDNGGGGGNTGGQNNGGNNGGGKNGGANNGGASRACTSMWRTSVATSTTRRRALLYRPST